MTRLPSFSVTSYVKSNVDRYELSLSSCGHQSQKHQRGRRRRRIRSSNNNNSVSLRLLLPIFILLCALIHFPNPVHGEYDVSEEQLARIPYRFASASFSHAGVVYSYGGATRNSSASTLFTSISFDPHNGQVIYADVPQPNWSPSTAYSQAVLLPDKNRVLLFGGCNYTSSVGTAAAATTTPSSSINDNNSTITMTHDSHTTAIRLYEYRFDTHNWTTLPIQITGGRGDSSTTLLPSNRKDFTATLSPINGKIYIYGGQDIYYQASAATQGREGIEKGVSLINDNWVYDPETNMFTQLPPVPGQPDSILYGHSAVALDNGIIVHLMGNGYYGTGYYDSSQNATMCDRALLLDTNTDTWSLQPLIGSSPQQIINGFAVLGPDRKNIYISGGFGASRTLQNISVSSNDLNALDTSTWSWVPLDQQTVGDPPKPRFYTCAELLHDAYVVVAFGVSEYFWYNDINVLRFYTFENGSLGTEWTANLDYPAQMAEIGSSSNTSLSIETKMAIAVGVLAAVVVTVAYVSWYHRDSAKVMLGRSYRCLIWTSSRAGEPMWTGLAHILSKTILACIFLAYLVYTIFQVANSSVATLTIQEPIRSVSVPDIRFCFDGWTNPSLGCQTETLSIDDCVSLDYISPLDMGIHQPYFGYTGTVDCYLFHPRKSFQLSGTPNAPFYNGSRIQFSFYGTAHHVDTPGLIHITLYPPGMDPNLAYYFKKSQYGYDYDTSALDDWLYDESNNLVSENTYTVEANTSSAVSYQITIHQYLQESAWNNFGIWYAYNATPSIKTQSLQGGRSATPRPLNMTGNNFLDVYPSSYTSVSLLDQRIYTILSSIGPCGGLLALLITLNSWIFGARPRSPWGIIHRILWTDRSRNSLLRGLREKFGGVAAAGNIPFINPVDKRVLTSQEADWHDIVMTSSNYRRRRWLKRRQKHQQQQNKKDDLKEQRAMTTAQDIEHQKQKNNSTLKVPYDQHHQISEKPSFGTFVALSHRNSNYQSQSTTLDDAIQKIEQLQRRVQLTELLLKTYYIDDEVFRGLHIALAQQEQLQQEQQDRSASDSSSILSSASTSRRHDPGTATTATIAATAGTMTENSYNDDCSEHQCDKSPTSASPEFDLAETPPGTPTTPPPAFNQHSSLFSTSTNSYASSSRDPPPPRFSSEIRASQLPPFYT
ncbi:hypothetical protein BDB00DRAFT_878857 [Zychaea mexicana]|uniref:uncharacterized protein n=1 Tax=Zychaea mexicana TaxID=64656 RepID=UPI0022FE0859|nr:uncharacterized protein BDB00DRAFT_878857 [Zychaea mexicana]KAI9484433.1 hypothetical protein BDB00DRAFT_878857 [Zychaea mexicana]